jgi:hypothetical protein
MKKVIGNKFLRNIAQSWTYNLRRVAAVILREFVF